MLLRYLLLINSVTAVTKAGLEACRIPLKGASFGFLKVHGLYECPIVRKDPKTLVANCGPNFSVTYFGDTNNLAIDINNNTKKPKSYAIHARCLSIPGKTPHAHENLRITIAAGKAFKAEFGGMDRSCDLTKYKNTLIYIWSPPDEEIEKCRQFPVQPIAIE